MELTREQQLMESVETSQEAQNFRIAAKALHRRIVELAKRADYPLYQALIEVNTQFSSDRQTGFAEIPVEKSLASLESPTSGAFGLSDVVALYLIAEQCGGVFPAIEKAA